MCNQPKCKCGRQLCQLCEKERAKFIMRNQVNGNKLNVCATCYKEVWGV